MRTFAFLLIMTTAACSCERIPELERKTTLTKNARQNQRVSDLKKWLYTCRAQVPAVTKSEDRPAMITPGQSIADFTDYFHLKGLSSIDSIGTKTLLGTAFMWDGNGTLLSVASWYQNAKDVECTNGVQSWTAVKTVGSDRGSDLIVFRLANIHVRPDTRWVARTDEPTLDDRYRVLATPSPGFLSSQSVDAQPLPILLNTGVDRDLLLFLPRPSEVSWGGVLVDGDFRVAGMVLPKTTGVGAAISVEKLQILVRSILDTGKVRRAYLGLKVRWDAPEGYQVRQVDVGGPAYQSGLRVEDLITKWDGTSLQSASSWQEPQPQSIGKHVSVTYKRGDKVYETQIVPAEAE